MDDSILQKLRRETRGLHEALESRIHIEEQLESPARYRRWLEVFWGLYGGFEAQILSGATELRMWLPDLDVRMRSQRLAEDLEVLGAPSVQVLPIADPPPLASVPEQFGCLYVLEGSTLGGRVLYHNIRDRLGYSSEFGASFFNGHGEQTGPMWKRFCDALEHYAHQHPAVQDRIVSAARLVFSTFEAWAATHL